MNAQRGSLGFGLGLRSTYYQAILEQRPAIGAVQRHGVAGARLITVAALRKLCFNKGQSAAQAMIGVVGGMVNEVNVTNFVARRQQPIERKGHHLGLATQRGNQHGRTRCHHYLPF